MTEPRPYFFVYLQKTAGTAQFRQPPYQTNGTCPAGYADGAKNHDSTA
jgi:hypothetical protein